MNELLTDRVKDKKLEKLIIDRFFALEYEYIGLINAETGELSTIHPLDPDSAASVGVKGNYELELQRSAPFLFEPGDTQLARKKLSLASVREKLEFRPLYSYAFNVQTRDGVRRKKWQFSYLDGSRRLIAYSRSDETALYNAEIDRVSGAFNREGFYANVSRWLGEHPESEATVLAFDVDRFKVYNDLFGSAAGDKLLRDIGTGLFGADLHGVICGRLDADRFAALVPAPPAQVRDIVGQCRSWFGGYREDYSIQAHFGAYRIGDKSLPVNTICDRAMLAQQSIKFLADEHFVWYNESMRESLLQELELEQALRQGLEDRAFVPYLQPQYDNVDGTLIGAEALARWPDAPRGILFPRDFIATLERTGLITALDLMMYEKVCSLIQGWQEEGCRVVPVSVNLSRRDIYAPELCETLCAIAAKYGVDRSLINLEITETAYTENPEQAIGVINKLREAGFVIEMDDFGSGYSSLNSLKSLPVDIVKLDLKFLENNVDGRSGIILNSVVQMSHWLGLRVIAEGVETARQADYLKTIDCRFVQGFYYAHPMEPEEFKRLLLSHSLGDNTRDMTVASFFDTEEFWNPDAQATVIFNTFVGAAGIFAFDGSGLFAERLNDSFFQVTGIPRTQFENNHNILDFCAREDLELVLGDLRRARDTDAEVVSESRWLLTDGSGRVIWERIRFRCIARSTTRCALYLAVENVTERKELEQQYLDEKAKTEFVLENSMISIWDYDLERRSCHWHYRMKNDQGYQPADIDDMPEAMIAQGMICQESVEDYLALYEAVARGEEKIERTIRFHREDGTDQWQRISYHTVFKNGRPTGAIGFSVNVTDTVLMERRFEGEARFLDEVHADNLIDKARIDLTLGVMESYSSFIGQPLCAVGISYEEANRRLELTAYDQQQRDTIRSFTREYLIGEYNAGNRQKQFEYRRKLSSGGKPVWVQITMKLHRDPTTHNINAFFYSYDVEDSKQIAFVMDKIYGDENSIIAVLDVEEDALHTYHSSQLEAETGMGSDIVYSQALPVFVETYIVEEERQAALKALSADTIVAELERGKKYTCVFPVIFHGQLRQKKWECSWLNGEHTKVVLMREDITELFNRQLAQQQRLDAVSAENAALSFDRQMLTLAIRQTYDMILTVNLSRNEWHELNEWHMTRRIGGRGSYDQLVTQAAEIIAPEHRERFIQTFERRTMLLSFGRGKETVELDYRQTGDDGKLHWIRTTVYFKRDIWAGEICAISFSRIIDDQKALESELERTAALSADELRQQQLFTDLFKVVLPIFCSLWSAGPEYRLLYSSGTLMAQCGYTNEEYISFRKTGQPAMISGEDLDFAAAEVMPMLRGDCQSYETEYRLRRKDGGVCWIKDIGRRVNYSADGPALVSVMVDITDQKQAETDLQVLLSEYKVVVEQSGKTVILHDLKSRSSVRYLVDNGIQLERSAQDVPRSMVDQGYIAPESVEAFLGFYESMHRGVPTGKVDVLLRIPPAEEYRWAHLDYTLVDDREGKPTVSVISMYDNNQQMEKEVAFSIWQEDLRHRIKDDAAFVEANLSKRLIIQEYGIITTGSSDYQDKIEATCAMVLPEEEQSCMEELDAERLISLYRNGVFREAFDHHLLVDGQWRWFHTDIHLIAHPQTDEVMAYFSVNDIDREKRDAEKLIKAASTDAVTGLMNRGATSAGVVKALEAAGPEDRFALFMIDVDNFKTVNDTFGHKRGDETLRSVAKAISACFRAGDIVGRIGGDEFMAFIKCGDARIARSKAKALLDGLRFSVGSIFLSASVGVVITERPGETLENLYNLADHAMYRAKRAGKNRFAMVGSTAKETGDAMTVESDVVQLQKLMEYMDGGIVSGELDPEGDISIIYASPSLFRHRGRTDPEGEGRLETLLDYVHEDDLPELRGKIRKLMEQGGFFSCVYRLRDQAEVWHQLRGTQLPQDGSGRIRLIGVVTDVTELKR